MPRTPRIAAPFCPRTAFTPTDTRPYPPFTPAPFLTTVFSSLVPALLFPTFMQPFR